MKTPLQFIEAFLEYNEGASSAGDLIACACLAGFEPDEIRKAFRRGKRVKSKLVDGEEFWVLR